MINRQEFYSRGILLTEMILTHCSDKKETGFSRKMPSIMIRLDPSRLHDPDLDLRYEIPDLLVTRSAGLIKDDGYDYEPEGNALRIYLRTSDLNSAVPQVITFLEKEHLHGNHLADAAQVGISEAAASATKEYRMVYPPEISGSIMP
jgi:hypothetical protein